MNTSLWLITVRLLVPGGSCGRRGLWFAQRQFPPGDEQIEMQSGEDKTNANGYLSPLAFIFFNYAARKMIAQTETQTTRAASRPLPPRPQPNHALQPTRESVSGSSRRFRLFHGSVPAWLSLGRFEYVSSR